VYPSVVSDSRFVEVWLINNCRQSEGKLCQALKKKLGCSTFTKTLGLFSIQEKVIIRLTQHGLNLLKLN
jgi:hypothetical protein